MSYPLPFAITSVPLVDSHRGIASGSSMREIAKGLQRAGQRLAGRWHGMAGASSFGRPLVIDHGHSRQKRVTRNDELRHFDDGAEFKSFGKLEL